METRSIISELVNSIAQQLQTEMELKLAQYRDKVEDLDKTINAPSGYTDIEGAAKYMGRTVQAIRGMVKRRTIPFYKADNRVQFKFKELESYMQEHKCN